MATKHRPKVVLVMPPQPGLLEGFATGLICLAGYLQRFLPSCLVEVLNLCSATSEEMLAEFTMVLAHTQGDGPLFVGITTTTASYQNALQCARAARAVRPDCCVILGGPHVTADSRNVVMSHRDIIDAVVVGEGERALAALVDFYPDFTQVPGLAYAQSDGTFQENAAPIPLQEADLDQLNILWHGQLPGRSGKFHCTTYVSARGCPLRCAFCSVANAPIRAKSVSRVKADVRLLVQQGHERISIEDNFFAQSPQRTRAVCQAFRELREQEGLNFTWDCQTRVESVARAGAIVELAAAGCGAVYLGVESVVPSLLLHLSKTRDPQRYVAQLVDLVVPALLAAGVGCYLNLQFGIPGETETDYGQTADILRRCGRTAADAGAVITIFPQLAVIYPGTQHFQDALAQGRFRTDVFEAFTLWEAHQKPVLHWLGEHFAHGTGGLPTGILHAEALRLGRFEIDPWAVQELSRRLSELSVIPGVEIFQYGKHLTATSPLAL